MTETSPVLGILCGGGPAPGLNGVISAAALYANKLGWKVYGFHDGYYHLAKGTIEDIKKNMIELTEDVVLPIAETGGSLVRPDRFDPSKSPQAVARVLSMFKELNIKYLIIIGGNDKISSTHLVTQGIDPAEMQVIVVPKTIDNDIQLPVGQTTFGFHSARKFCTELVKNMIVDARSAPRWFLVETMGRHTGHLALSVAEASGSHLCIIPEDFENKSVTLKDICDIFEGAIIKRAAAGKPYGVGIISQGLINLLPKEEQVKLFDHGYVTMTSDGQINLDDAELSRYIRNEMNTRLKAYGLDIRVNPKKIGYELRCCKPVSFDAVYSQELGYGAIEGFKQKHSNCIVVWENGKVFYRSFRSLMNPEDGKIYPRKVDVTSQNYKISREYLWHVRDIDIQNEQSVAKMAKIIKHTPEEFVARFSQIAESSK